MCFKKERGYWLTNWHTEREREREREKEKEREREREREDRDNERDKRIEREREWETEWERESKRASERSVLNDRKACHKFSIYFQNNARHITLKEIESLGNRNATYSSKRIIGIASLRELRLLNAPDAGMGWYDIVTSERMQRSTEVLIWFPLKHGVEKWCRHWYVFGSR